MTVYVILRKGKPALGAKESIIVARSKKQAIESFREFHPRVKGRLTVVTLLEYNKKKSRR